VAFEAALFIHLDFLSQPVTNALQSLAYGRRVDARTPCESFGRPAGVVVELAEPPLFGGQREQGAREHALLILGPTSFVGVEHRWTGEVIV
jgi:hypothetical protein